MKPIRFTRHAREQCVERGAAEQEVVEAIRLGRVEEARHGRKLYRANFQFNAFWCGTRYALKQVAAVVKEEAEEFVVITVYTFYF